MQSVRVDFPLRATADMASFLLLRGYSMPTPYGVPVLEESARALSPVTPARAPLDPFLCLAIDPGSGWGVHPFWSEGPAARTRQGVILEIENDTDPDAQDAEFVQIVHNRAGHADECSIIAPGQGRIFYLDRNHTRLLIKLCSPSAAPVEAIDG